MKFTSFYTLHKNYRDCAGTEAFTIFIFANNTSSNRKFHKTQL